MKKTFTVAQLLIALLTGAALAQTVKATAAPFAPSDDGLHHTALGTLHWPLLTHTRQLADPERQLTIEQILAAGDDLPWAPATRELAVGSRVVETRWYRMELALPALEGERWILSHPFPHFGAIDLWIVDEGTIRSHRTISSATPVRDRPFPVPGAAFVIPPSDERPISAYLRITPTGHGLRFDDSIIAGSTFAAWADRETAIYMVWAGVMLGLLFYNLVVFASTLDRTYLYYCGFMAACTTYMFGLSGRGFLYLWTDSPVWDALSPVYAGLASQLFASFFARSFLSLKAHAPRLHRGLCVLEGLILANAAISLAGYSDLAASLMTITALFLYPTLLVSGVFSWRAGLRYARFYTLSWISFCASMVYFALLVVGVFEASEHTGYWLLSANLAEGILLATALGDRINSFRRSVERLNLHLEEARQELEIRVQERTTELVTAQRRLVDAARRSGMAEMAIGVLHEIGNVLNTVVTRSKHLDERLRALRIDRLQNVVDLMRDNSEDLARFLSDDRAGRNLVPYVDLLARHLATDRAQMQEDLAKLDHAVEQIQDIVSRQGELARHQGVRASVNLREVAKSAIDACEARGLLSGIEVELDASNPTFASTEQFHVVFILEQLIENAVQAMRGGAAEARRLSVAVRTRSEQEVEITVADRGHGFESALAARIFQHGYSTDPTRRGFGLHHCANLATELGGHIEAESAGPGHGAVFRLVLPVDGEKTEADVTMVSDPVEASSEPAPTGRD